MSRLLHDVRLAVRGLRRAPGFTFVSLITLAFGIAVTTTMFSVVRGVLLQPLAYRDADALVAIAARVKGADVQMAFPEVFDLREHARSFSHVICDKTITGNITGVDEPERIEVRGVTGAFFPMLGVAPLIGRAFTEADEVPGIAPIGVISYGLWQRRFGGESSAIGRGVRIDDDDYTIVGVMPPSFAHPNADPARPVDFWIVSGFSGTPFPPPTRYWRTANVFARLAPGVTIERAREELQRIAAQWRADYPDVYPPTQEWELRLEPVHDLVVGDARRPLLLLFAAVGVVLLIACANVAGLQLARQAARAGEVAVRQALGATRWQIARPLLVESVVLSVAAAVVGVALSLGGTSLARMLAPSSLPRASTVAIDVTVLVFAAAIAVATGIAFGLAPALSATRGRRLALEGMLRAGSRGASPGVAAARFRSALVIAELALALVLLCGTGLLMRSLAALYRTELGFRADRLLTMELTVPYPNDVSRAKYIEAPGRLRLYAEVLRRTRDVAGVADAAMTSSVPLASAATAVNTRIVAAEGAPATTEADAPRYEMISVSDGYFRTMGIPIVVGREFTRDDREDATRVAIVSAAAARRLWPGATASGGPGSAIGRRVKIGPTGNDSPWMTVVGVARDVRTSRLDAPTTGQVYASSLQQPPRPVHLVVRALADASPLTEPIRRTVRQVEHDQPVYAVRTMDQILASRLAQRRFAMVSLAAFSALAILLAAIGLYGLIAFSVAQRRREIAVRMALGGTAPAIARLVLRDGVRLALAGAALGVLGVWVSGRALAGLLYGVTLMDPWTLALTVSGLVMVGAAASVIPGRRAAAVNPIAALRDE